MAGGMLAIGIGGIASAQGIYSCVDARGNKITADRPIIECIDRTQRELSRSGRVKREIGPSLTAQEQAALEAKEREAAEIRAREAEDKRRDRALLVRYPTRAEHDKERAIALDQIDEVIKASSKRTVELAEQRKAVDAELEFYAKDPSRVPGSLKRKISENANSIEVQKKFIADQEAEKKRVSRRFDEELLKLSPLWAPRTDASAVPVAAGVRPAAKN